VWIVAKRDILYSESVGSEAGLWVVGEDGEDEDEVVSAVDNYPSYESTFYDSPSGEYGADDYTSDEGESDEFETDEGGSDGYAAEEDVSAEDASEEFASDEASDEASNAASDQVPSENLLIWRGWDMERLPACLEDYASLLKVARHQFRLRAEGPKKICLFTCPANNTTMMMTVLY
jgi:hypothetical protein